MQPRSKRYLLNACAAAAIAVQWPASAQVAGDDACPKFALDIASFATCDGDRVARAGDAIGRVTPAAAYAWKEARGYDVLLIDVRTVAEATARGVPAFVDAVVPLADAAEADGPPAGDPEFRLHADPGFAGRVAARVADFGGSRETPLLLICREGSNALRAALALRAAGFADVRIVEGGYEGAFDDDGQRRGGWKAAGLPTLAWSGEAARSRP